MAEVMLPEVAKKILEFVTWQQGRRSKYRSMSDEAANVLMWMKAEFALFLIQLQRGSQELLFDVNVAHFVDPERGEGVSYTIWGSHGAQASQPWLVYIAWLAGRGCMDGSRVNEVSISIVHQLLAALIIDQISPTSGLSIGRVIQLCVGSSFTRDDADLELELG